MGNHLKKNAMLAGIAGMVMLALTSCGGATEVAAPSASVSVSATPTVSASPSKTASTPKQVASAIYSARQSFLKAAKEWDDNRCSTVLPTAQPGLEKGLCTANVLTLQTLAETITIQLNGKKPWPDEVADLADETYRYVNQVAMVADTTEYSDGESEGGGR
ncbi:hypothetical protein ACIPYV_16645 [Paenarthrobacter nicotinovorans]|uniref:hypothetical protein n=1 Tax=Paenarthrobacter nicotinovorans TaxID=29320 RepID=UPI0037F47CF9